MIEVLCYFVFGIKLIYMSLCNIDYKCIHVVSPSNSTLSRINDASVMIVHTENDIASIH